jgi:hypothetical protein
VGAPGCHAREGQAAVGQPKSEAGVRHVGRMADALLFPAPSGGQMRSNSQMHKAFQQGRPVAGRPDLRFHDLRHTGATLAAATRATLAELMLRLGHSTPQAALIYQHAIRDRDRPIAEALSQFHMEKVVVLRRRTAKHHDPRGPRDALGVRRSGRGWLTVRSC